MKTKLAVSAQMLTALLIAAALTPAFAQATPKSPNRFCVPHVLSAVKKLTEVNGSIYGSPKAQSLAGVDFKVTVSEAGYGADEYLVKTTGGHDCIVLLIEAVDIPTLRN